ncbi:MAG: ABC transporter ATP-binding protein [Alphaproteobacteria bacterium]
MPTAADPILSIRGLEVDFSTPDGTVNAVRGVDIDVGASETVAIVGESGSGKSQIMMALMGLLARNGVARGAVHYRRAEILGLAPKHLNKIRGASLTMIFQEPMTSLDPLYPIERQISEILRYHGKLARNRLRPRVLELLELVGIPAPEERLGAYPHELSGGQRQRVMIAMALANNPDILIADEPTTALDVTIQAQILVLLADLQKKLGMSIILISHDLGIVRAVSDRVYVMNAGQVVEHGPTAQIFSKPKHAYTKMLLAAEPEGRKAAPDASAPILLAGKDIRVTFTSGARLGRAPQIIRAVDGISLEVRQGQTLGIVGESGSGKSTLGRALLKLVHATGEVEFRGRAIDGLSRAALRPLRAQMQLVFQDPYGSLSPRLTAGQIVTEGLLVHEPGMTRAQRDERAVAAFEEVQLDPAMRNRYPHEFSGGQRQRIAIARAMILKPAVVVLDEPTSALDRSVQKQIITLLRDLQKTHGLAYLFISHDLAVIRAMADTVMVMKDGVVVEEGRTEQIFGNPREPYTIELMAAALDHLRPG